MRMHCHVLVFSCVVLVVLSVLFSACFGQTNFANPPYQPNYQPGYQTGYQPGYQTQLYQTSGCNDLNCNPNQCCIETYRGPVCVALTISYDQAYCARLKKCTSNTNCPTVGTPGVPGCCVQALEPSYSRTCPLPSYNGYNIGNGYNSNQGNNIGNIYNSNQGTRNTNNYNVNGYNSGYSDYFDPKTFSEGYCRPPGAAANAPCYKSLPGAETTGCPCTGTLRCLISGPVGTTAAVPIVEPFVAGICAQPV